MNDKEMSKKEAAFVKEYEALLKKYNVSLVTSPWVDEWGHHLDLMFIETGKYRTICYSPKFKEKAERYCGMGG